MRLRYHWRSDNNIDLLIDGDQFFPRMLAAIEGARQSLLLEFYMVSSGQVTDSFIDALTRAARRGVEVCWLVDDFGGRDLSSEDCELLRAAGVNLIRYNPVRLRKLQKNFARDHRKLMLVDQVTAFIGGTGISDEYLKAVSEFEMAGWHEIMLQVSGPVVADLLDLFRQQWQRSANQVLALTDIGYQRCGDAKAKVAVIQGLYQQDIKLSFIRHIRNAEQRVWLATAYFLPSLSVRRSLRQAARKGIDVRVIVAGPCTDHRWIYHASKRYYRRLLKAGVRIYEYQPTFLHTKIGVCDDWVSAGSCNLDHWNLRWNLEANLEVVEPALTLQVIKLLESDMQRSEEITYERWQKRPWHLKLRELIWSLVSQLLLKIR